MSCQTSDNAEEPAATPPNTIMRSPAGSKTAVCQMRAGGGVPSVASEVQPMVPARSNDHASFVAPVGPEPPNTIMRCRTASTIAECAVRAGGDTADAAWIHGCVPAIDIDHVSANEPES